MPSVRKIRQTIERKLPEAVAGQFDYPQGEGDGPQEVLALIAQMDRLLTPGQRLNIMQEQGCCKTGKPDAAHRAFGRKHKGKTVGERIALFGEMDTPHKAPCRVNEDGTLSVYWRFGEEGKYGCVCGMVRKMQQPAEVSATFCGCCGGHIRHNYQNSLGVKLRLKEIVSSAISSGGEKHCEFLFEIE